MFRVGGVWCCLLLLLLLLLLSVGRVVVDGRAVIDLVVLVVLGSLVNSSWFKSGSMCLVLGFVCF